MSDNPEQSSITIPMAETHLKCSSKGLSTYSVKYKQQNSTGSQQGFCGYSKDILYSTLLSCTLHLIQANNCIFQLLT